VYAREFPNEKNFDFNAVGFCEKIPGMTLLLRIIKPKII